MSSLRALVGAFGDEVAFLTGRGRATLLVILGLPLFYPTVMSWLYEGNVAIERPTLVVDEDGSELSRQLQIRLDATQEIRIVGRPGTVSDGIEAVRRGDAEMLLWIPADFTRSIQRGRTGRLPFWVDSANMVTYAGGMPGLTNVVGSLNEDLGARFFMDKGMTTAQAAPRSSRPMMKPNPPRAAVSRAALRTMERGSAPTCASSRHCLLPQQWPRSLSMRCQSTGSCWALRARSGEGRWTERLDGQLSGGCWARWTRPSSRCVSRGLGMARVLGRVRVLVQGNLGAGLLLSCACWARVTWIS